MTKKRNHRAAGDESVPAVMRVEKGEKIVGGWITPEIPGVGMYKLLAKKRCDGTCEWIHFIQRSTGKKEKFVGGTVRSEMEVVQVVAAINRSLERVYGPQCRLQPAGASAGAVDASKAGNSSIN